MYQAAQLELRSAALLRGHTADRPSFEVMIRRGWSGERRFQVFAMQQGLLFLERNDQQERVEGQRMALAAVVLGGAIGGLFAAMMTKPKEIDGKRESGLDLKSDDELLELARVRKRSFVVTNEEILSMSVDGPGGWDGMFGHRTLVGWIRLESVSQGRVAMEFRDPAMLLNAIESLSRRYGNRVQANVEFDERRKRFVPVRR